MSHLQACILPQNGRQGVGDDQRLLMLGPVQLLRDPDGLPEVLLGLSILSQAEEKLGPPVEAHT